MLFFFVDLFVYSVLFVACEIIQKDPRTAEFSEILMIVSKPGFNLPRFKDLYVQSLS